MKILKAYCIPEQLVKIIELMYYKTSAKVVSPDGDTQLFEITAGILQGDTLAPFLFAIVLDYCMRKATEGKEDQLGFTIYPRRSRRIKPIKICDLDFADDICLTTELQEQAQELLLLVEINAAKIGLRLNAKKTEYILYNQPDILELRAYDGSKINKVEDFQYLGSWIDSTEKDVKVRKAQAWTACHKMLWKSNLSRNLKERIFITTVESVLLYGAETWSLNKTIERSLDGCYTRMLRMAFNIHWSSHITNVELYNNMPKVTEKIRQRRMKLAGHCVRHSELMASNLVLWEPTQGKRRVGRRKTTFVDSLKKDTGLESTTEIRSLMQDRKKGVRIGSGGNLTKVKVK